MTERWEVTTEVRVRYADVDQMGVVYYARYLELFEVARTEWIRACWKPYREIERAGLYLPVVHAVATYRRSFHYDDIIRIIAWLVGFTSARLRFGYELFGDDDGTPRASGATEHAFLNAAGKHLRVPEELALLLHMRVPNYLPPLFARTT